MLKSSKLNRSIPGYPAGTEIPAGKPLNVDAAWYVYVLKLENKDVSGDQIIDEKTNEPIFNWYVGISKNPISRWLQHSTGSLYLSAEGYKALMSQGPRRLIHRLYNHIDTGSLLQDRPIAVGQRSLEDLLDYDERADIARCSAQWTKRHKPIEMTHLHLVNRIRGAEGEVIEKDHDYRRRVLKMENDLSKKLIEHYGNQHVAGGNWCTLTYKNNRYEPYSKGGEFDFEDFKFEGQDVNIGSNVSDSEEAQIIKAISEKIDFNYGEIWPHWPIKKLEQHVENLAMQFERANVNTDDLKEKDIKEAVTWDLGIAGKHDAPDMQELLEWAGGDPGYFEDELEFSEDEHRMDEAPHILPNDLFETAESLRAK